MMGRILTRDEWQRFLALAERAKALGLHLRDLRTDSAERFEVKRAGRVVYSASDLDGLADWLA